MTKATHAKFNQAVLDAIEHVGIATGIVRNEGPKLRPEDEETAHEALLDAIAELDLARGILNA